MSKSRANNRLRLAYAALAVAFVATVAYVLTVLPGRSAPPVAVPSPSPYEHGDGLSDSHDGYLMRPVIMPENRGKGVPLMFQILGSDGAPLVHYETVQTKQLHLYLIRDDISGYRHLHPVLDGETWSTTLDIDDGGSYRVYAEFTPKGGHATTLGLPFVIAGDTKLVPLPGPAASATAGPHTVTRLDGIAHLRAGQSALLRFGVNATLEPYLGSYAHMSAFEVRTGALLHMHPAASELTFHTQFANRGEYRLFLEFQVDGKVHRADFTVFVA
ncbi:hypothetical protein [Allorhizocola rhizosphaerae]|uniref:hypothetical protein n=1 Tax=Allorhizocola rhizosphaerae TaxID=1872709 RepID=UPI000E3D254E|nr:hypothetical protein [Allorhizocola rhizosphaerae]